MEGLEGLTFKTKLRVSWRRLQTLMGSVFLGILGLTVDTRSCFRSRIYLKCTLDHSPSAEKHMCLVLALRAREGPNTSRQS